MQNRFVADNIRRFFPKKRAIPFWEAHEIIGKRGNFYSVLELRVLRPTLEWPDIAISLSLSNGKSYTYTQVNPQELQRIMDFLAECHKQILAALPGLQQEEAAVKTQADAAAQQMALIRQMTRMQGMPEEGEYPPQQE